MKNCKLNSWVLVVLLVFIVAPQQAHAGLFSIVTDGLLAPFSWLAYTIFQFISLITYFSAIILNHVVDYTIVDMAKNVAKSGALDQAWKTIRDVANMGFIFVLLYAAIQTILGVGKNTKKLIVNMIVVAILVNFSLFATRVVIDASNMLAMLFYNAIAPGAMADEASVLNVGLSNSLMEPLRISGIMKDVGFLEGKKIIMISILGSIFSIVAAFVFFAISLMLIIRFVVLMFVMILSPIAFVSFVLPGLGGQTKKWTDALVSQAFFAPIYFMLTWIVIVLTRGLFKPGGESLGKAIGGVVTTKGNALEAAASAGSVGIMMNFIIVIAFLITSLIIAKQMSQKAGGAATKMALGFAGSASMGLAGRVGRASVGSFGQSIADNEKLKRKADDKGFGGAMARLSLKAGQKTSKSSFDMKGTGIGSMLGAGKAHKGGYADDQKKAAEIHKKFGESLAPSDILVDEAKQRLEKAKTEREVALRSGNQTRISAAEREVDTHQRRMDEFQGVDEKEAIRRLELQGYDDEQIERLLAEDKEKPLKQRQYVTLNAAQKRKEGYAEYLTDPNVISSKRGILGITGFGFVKRSSRLGAASLRKKKKPLADIAKAILDETGGGDPGAQPSSLGGNPDASPSPNP